jgi:tRNA threonylcarbamoyladenosine biosynthesis protein TsaB
MALLLSIDTALETASICLSEDDHVLLLETNDRQQDHASWLHAAIASMFEKTGRSLQQLDAVAVTIGPGSYTGLRVGLSAAKGFCYALQIPLIAVGTLEIMAYAVKDEAHGLLCPMIDARRMEVFYAVYDNQLTEIIKPAAMVINEKSFNDLLFNHFLIFSGSGSSKLQTILTHSNASFSQKVASAIHLSAIAAKYFQLTKFTDLAYVEPLYVKEFYSPAHDLHR